jgi:NAD(P)-dependent dehydrogenase (short-subunit alcohol dehydrogenase family)
MVTKLLAFDLSQHKIRVIGIHPGWVKTDMGTKNALLEPEFSVKSFLAVIQTIDDSMNGKLINYDGKVLES